MSCSIIVAGCRRQSLTMPYVIQGWMCILAKGLQPVFGSMGAGASETEKIDSFMENPGLIMLLGN